MRYWIFTLPVDPEWETEAPGTPGDFWTDPRRNPQTGAVIRRKDGMGAGEPSWKVGDEIVFYDPELGRCVGIWEVASTAWWEENDEQWWSTLARVHLNLNGPAPSDIGITIQQGARHLLSPEEFGRARRALLARDARTRGGT